MPRLSTNNFIRNRSRQTVRIVENPARPCSQMIIEPKPDIGFRVVTLPRLDDLRPILFE